MIAAIGAWFAGQWGKALPYIIGAAVIALAVLLLVSKLLGAGKAAAQAEAGMAALKRTREANDARMKASQPVSREEEAHDPFNRDSR